jgi:NAD(P)H-nitrite reductase large subunit
MKAAVLVNAAVSLFLVLAGLLAYDRLVVRPAQVIGVVDVGEVYRLKEAEFARLVTKPGSGEERDRAMLLARQFAQRLPLALEELPRDCSCLVVLKTAIAGATAHTVDLTPYLKAKLEAK